MSTKKYVEGLVSDLDTKIKENRKKKERNIFLFNLGSIFTGVVGFCLLFGNPWFGIPLIGGAVALYLERKLNEKNLDSSYAALANQKDHLENVLSKGIDIKTETMKNRRATINNMEPTRQRQQSDYYSQNGTHQFGNMLVGGSIALAGLITNPFIALGALACVGVKHLCDRKFPEAYKTLENTIAEMNNISNDYNIGYRVIQNKNKNKKATTKQAVAAPTKGRNQTVTPSYSKEDEEAVDAYLRTLQGVGEKSVAKQKRKV